MKNILIVTIFTLFGFLFPILFLSYVEWDISTILNIGQWDPSSIFFLGVFEGLFTALFYVLGHIFIARIWER